jgi:hypothetical protein
MGILFVLACLLGFTINMTQGLQETVTMIVPPIGYRPNSDRILRHCAVIPRRDPFIHGHSVAVHASYSHCNGYCECLCRRNMDWKYLCRSS